MSRELYHNRDVLLQIRKRGKLCTLGKLVKAKPLNEWVLAMPYRHRQTVGTVSIPPSVLQYVTDRGASRWIVRLDSLGQCYSYPLSEVEKGGWLKSSFGIAEYFVPLERFQPIPWQDWPYVENSVLLSPDSVQPQTKPALTRQMAFALGGQ